MVDNIDKELEKYRELFVNLDNREYLLNLFRDVCEIGVDFKLSKDTKSVINYKNQEEIMKDFFKPIPQKGKPIGEVLNEFKKIILDGSIKELQHFFGRNGIMFICNPNNPTSRMIKKGELFKLIKNNPKIFFVIDETYLLFRKDYFQQSMLREVGRFNNLFVVFSLSKFFGIGGLRVGIGAGNKKIIEKLKKEQLPYQIPIINQKLVPELLNDNLWIDSVRTKLQKEKEKMLKKLNKISSLNVIDSETNFVLIESKKDINLSKLLKKENILVRSGEEFEGLGYKWIRVCIKKRTDNECLINALKNILKN
ncbi:MAG: aminotransferase class I/II-fold pyridoxal phosphate-dependent enzyme [Nanoarchaeota archaeon]